MVLSKFYFQYLSSVSTRIQIYNIPQLSLNRHSPVRWEDCRRRIPQWLQINLCIECCHTDCLSNALRFFGYCNCRAYIRLIIERKLRVSGRQSLVLQHISALRLISDGMARHIFFVSEFSNPISLYVLMSILTISSCSLQPLSGKLYTHFNSKASKII
jgi:hypothetical protein